MKALITGGAGNLGRRLVQLFVESRHEARVFDLPQVDYSFFEGVRGVDILKGDIRDEATARAAVEGVDAVLHLAALIPPASERNRATTLAINVGGTRNLLAAIGGRDVHFVLASSVATYGDTTKEEPPISVSYPQTAIDVYSDSKIETERLLKASGIPYTILRIAPISIPEVLEPPDVWPYRADQRVEFVNRDDVADALYACALTPAARGKVLNIAGGKTWQMTGYEYVTTLYRAMRVEDDPVFSDQPGWFDWYDTEEAQALLRYQNTPFSAFIAKLEKAAAEAFGW